MTTKLAWMKEFLLGAGSTTYVHLRPWSVGEDEAAQDRHITSSISEITKRAQDFSSNADFWQGLLALFEHARFAASDKRWIAAQTRLTEATVLVNRAISSEALRGTRIRLAIAPLGWFIGLYLLQLLMHWLENRVSWAFVITPEYFQYLWLGMLGGTTIVLWGIVKHGTEMTFDRAYTTWYVFKPALGAIMGVVVVLFVQAGFFTLQGSLDIKNTTPLLVLAFIGGFSERFFIQVIDRVITTILGGEKSPSQPKPVPTPAIPPIPAAVQRQSTRPAKGKKKSQDTQEEK